MREPLWREEFSIEQREESYVTRRQFGKFLTLASLGMFVGNLWILARPRRQEVPPRRVLAGALQIPVGGVKLFGYPTDADPCILVHPDADTWVAYSQKCTHLSCAVYYAHERHALVCPCHKGSFAVASGAVLAGPPVRRLPRIRLEREGGTLVAVGVET